MNERTNEKKEELMRSAFTSSNDSELFVFNLKMTWKKNRETKKEQKQNWYFARQQIAILCL